MNTDSMQKKGKLINNLLEYSLMFFCALFILFSPYFKNAGKITFWSGIIFWFSINVAELRQKFYLAFSLTKYLNKVIVVFLVSIVISTIFSLDLYHSQRILFNHYTGYVLIIFMGFSMIKSSINLVILELIFMLTGAIIGFGGCVDYLQLHSKLLSSFGVPINLVSYLLIYIPINYAIVLFTKNKWLKLIGIINLILLFFCLFMNASNTPICSILSAVIFITFFKSKRLAVSLIIFFLILSIIVFINYGKYMLIDLHNDVLNRLGLWKTALKIFMDFPVCGAGLGMFEKLVNSYKYLPLEGYRDGNIHLHAHSVYLEVLAETGIFGLAAFCSVFIVFFKKNLTVIKNIGNGKKALFLGALASIFSNLFVGLTSSIITVGFLDALMFWLLFGIAAGLSENV